MGKKSRRHKPNKSSSEGLTRREAIQVRRQNNIPSIVNETPPEKMNRLLNRLKLLSKDKWSMRRITAFLEYQNAFADYSPRDFSIFFTEEDKKFFKVTYKDKEELSLIRVVALASLSCMCLANLKQEDSSHCHQLAIQVCNEATEYEKQKLVPLGIGNYNVFEKLKEDSLGFLENLKAGMGERHGGDNCDVCGKFVKEYGVDFMTCCGKCQLSYYCSKECQKHDWEYGGHKWCCRKKGEFKAGDTVSFVDPLNPVAHGSVARLEAPVVYTTSSGGSLKPQKWFVSVETESGPAKLYFVLTKNLRRVRTKLWAYYGYGEKRAGGKRELMAELMLCVPKQSCW